MGAKFALVGGMAVSFRTIERFTAASEDEVAEARHLLDLITERGFNRNKDLQKDLDGYIERFKD